VKIALLNDLVDIELLRLRLLMLICLKLIFIQNVNIRVVAISGKSDLSRFGEGC
jgi:hypothetical protein